MIDWLIAGILSSTMANLSLIAMLYFTQQELKELKES
jgi:hypothetical protein